MKTATSTSIKLLSGLKEIHSRYHGYLIDAWGVLHDGHQLYPHTLDCLKELRNRGKKVIILSNAARRNRTVAKELQRLSIGPELYLSVLSSGELSWYAMLEAIDDGSLKDKKAYYLGPLRSRGLLDGLDLNWIDNIEQADIILNTGAPTGNPSTTRASESLLATAARRNIPMICANPGLVAIRGGEAGISAGALAKRYDELGGSRIEYHGKPFAPIYTQALALLNLPASQILAVGDAFETDIRGGYNAGLDTCLIANGIHREQLKPLSPKRVLDLAPADAIPDYVAEYLSW